MVPRTASCVLCLVLLGASSLAHAQVSEERAPEAPAAYVFSPDPYAGPRPSAPALELSWVLIRTSRSSRFFRLYLFVRVDGGPARRIDLGEVPELLRDLCMDRPGPEMQLRFRHEGAGTERFIVERNGTRYRVRRQDRTTRPFGWAPWRSYDPDAVREWRFEGPATGSYVLRAFVDGREHPCSPGTL